MTEKNHTDAQPPALRMCECKGIANIEPTGADLFRVRCKSCGRKTMNYASPIEAAEEWNERELSSERDSSDSATSGSERVSDPPPLSSPQESADNPANQPADKNPLPTGRSSDAPDAPKPQAPSPVPSIRLVGPVALTVRALLASYATQAADARARDEYALAVGRAILAEVK
jgi:hypothetical protein